MPPKFRKSESYKCHDENPYGKIQNPPEKETVPKRARVNRDLSKFGPR